MSLCVTAQWSVTVASNAYVVMPALQMRRENSSERLNASPKVIYLIKIDLGLNQNCSDLVSIVFFFLFIKKEMIT